MVPGVERAVPEEAVRGTSHVVRSRLENHVHQAGRVQSGHGFRCACQHFEFADGVDRWLHAARIQLGVHVIGAIEEEVVRIFPSAVDAEREIAPHRSGGALCGRKRAGHEQRQLEKIPAVERHIENLAVVDDGAQRR